MHSTVCMYSATSYLGRETDVMMSRLLHGEEARVRNDLRLLHFAEKNSSFDIARESWKARVHVK